jgi:hypothetical protein
MSKNKPKFTQEEFHQFFLYRGRAGPDGVSLFEGMGNKDNPLSSLCLKTNKMHNGLALSLHKKLTYFRCCSKLGMDLSRAPYKGVTCFPTHTKVLPRGLHATSTQKIRLAFYM